MSASHFERLLEKQELRIRQAAAQLKIEKWELDRIRAVYAKEMKERENGKL